MSRALKVSHILLLLAALAVSARAQDVPAAGARPLPASAFELDGFAGQVVLVDFWASWCAPCRLSLPWLNAMQQKYGERGLQVVMVNLDHKPGAAAKMAAEIAPGIRQFEDPEGVLAAQYELEGMPSSYLYDREGKLIASHIGFLKTEREPREDELAAALNRKEP